jgi:putative protease
MCAAVSGRCFTSQFLFGKSANRGECLQPCRRSYLVKDEDGNELRLENNRVMSAKDLCTVRFIEEMKKAGVKGFKIEGRNRDARYVDKVVRIYRKALDKKLSEKEINESAEELDKVYNRGFSEGFYLKAPGVEDFSKAENSSAKERKSFAGKVSHYYSGIGVGLLKLSSELKQGDKIIVIGKTTGFLECQVDSIEKENKKISKGVKGDEVGIKLPRVRKNDEVYVVEENF